MAFYKYGLAFLAGTGFGTAMTTLRNSRCPLHKHDDSCSYHRRHRPFDASGASPAETGRGREEYYDALEKGKKRCPKKQGGKEKKEDKSEEFSN